MSTVSISQSPRCNLLQRAASKLGFGTFVFPSHWGRDNHMTAVRQHGHAAGYSINRCKCNLAQPHSILQCFHVFLIAVLLFCRLCLHGRLLLLSWIRLTIDHPFVAGPQSHFCVGGKLPFDDESAIIWNQLPSCPVISWDSIGFSITSHHVFKSDNKHCEKFQSSFVSGVTIICSSGPDAYYGLAPVCRIRIGLRKGKTTKHHETRYGR